MKTEPFVVFDDPDTEITEDQILAVLEWSSKNQHLFGHIATDKTSPDWAGEYLGDE